MSVATSLLQSWAVFFYCSRQTNVPISRNLNELHPINLVPHFDNKLFNLLILPVHKLDTASYLFNPHFDIFEHQILLGRLRSR